MKNILLLLYTILIPLSGNSQLPWLFGSLERSYSELSELERQFLETYSEANRWEAFHKGEQQMLENPTLLFEPEWENLGPNTIDTLAGRMLCLTLHPDDPNILYGGAGTGGLWRSEDAGANWESLTDELPSMRVSAVAVNPFNPDELLIGTGIGQVQNTALQPGVGVLKSMDGGENWLPTGFNYSLAAVVSTYELIYDPLIEGRVYLGATNGFFISEDGGENWQMTDPNRFYDIELHPNDPDVLFAGVQNIGLCKSEDKGLSWAPVTNGLPTGDQIFRTAVAICSGSPDHMLVKMVNNGSFNTAGVYKSEDGGESWFQIVNAPDVACQPGNPSACSGWLFNTVGIAPDDPDKLYLGGVQFWYSLDGGDSWTWKDYLSNGSGDDNSNLVYVDHWDIDFDPDSPGRVYVACDGGIIRSDDYGATWTRLSNGLINAMFYSTATDPANPNFMIGGLHDHGLQRLIGDDGNLTWERWTTNDGINTLIDHEDPAVLYGNVQNGAVFKSTDFGSGVATSFLASNGITESGPWITPLLMDPGNAAVLYTVSNAKIYKTTNGAGFWQSMASIPNIRTMTISPINSDYLYAHAYTGNSWTFYRSENAGEQWFTVPSATIPSWGVTGLAADPHVFGRVYAVRNSAFANQDHIKVSEDHGATWTDITSDFPDIKVNDILVSPYNPDHLFLATDLGVYFSENRGTSWCPFNNNLPRIYCMHLEVSPADTTLRVATLGRGVWKTSLAELPFAVSANEPVAPHTFTLSAFPNPVKEEITIAILSENVGEKLEIVLLDNTGKYLESLYTGKVSDSRFETSVTLPPHLTAGVYYLKVRIGKWLKHQKLVKR